MMNRIVVFSVLLCLISVSCAKESEKVPLVSANVELPKELLSVMEKEFSDYTYISHFTGNIDADTLEEIVLVVERICQVDEEKASEDSKCRLTAFLKPQTDKSYKVIATNSNVISCSDCGGAGVGDPIGTIQIMNGKVRFTSMFGASTKTIIEETYDYYSPTKKWKKTRLKTKWYRMEDTLPNGKIKNHVKIQTPKDFGDVYF